MPLTAPKGFPEDFWLPVLAAEATARIALLEALARIPLKALLSSPRIDGRAVEAAVSPYLIAVVATFADQACLAAKADVLPPVRLDATVEEFMAQVLAHTYYGLDNEKIREAWPYRGVLAASSTPLFASEMREMLIAASWHAEFLGRTARLLTNSDQVVVSQVEQKAKARRTVILPILKRKGWTIPQWARAANMNQAVAYAYMNGESDPRRESRVALAGALGIAVTDLPN
jgi:hypothetical protein